MFKLYYIVKKCHTLNSLFFKQASIVSACGSPLGLGTDIGGSARIPAFNCGIFGHKLTTGEENTIFINSLIIVIIYYHAIKAIIT